MNVIKKYLELYIDIVVFLGACVFAFSGFAQYQQIRRAFNEALVDKGVEQITIGIVEEIYTAGDELVALLLLPEGVNSAEVDGMEFTHGNLRSAITYIDGDSLYFVERKQESDGVHLVVVKIPPQEG